MICGAIHEKVFGMSDLLRFVSYGTAFKPAESDFPSLKPGEHDLLGRREVAVDVGAACGRLAATGPWILDHHFVPEPFPSAAAAVLAHAKQLRDYYGEGKSVVVTHAEPDFDALLSAWLFRQVTSGALSQAGAHDVWRTEDWMGSNVGWSGQPADPVRAATLLAKYSACVDSARLGAVRCAKVNALHSVFLAARYRRGFSDGLSWFFDAAWEAMVRDGRNPFLDPLFDSGGPLDLELRLLEVQSAAYDNDISRARRTIVSLPIAKDFGKFFTKVKELPLAQDIAADPALIAPDGHAIVDGAWIREPTCFLFKEWARLDTENSALGRGFDFLAVAYANGRSGKNSTDYFFSLDPERANGKHLYGVWEALQTRQAAAVENGDVAPALGKTSVRPGFEARAVAHEEAFFDPWWDGSNTNGTLVATPMGGAFGFAGVRQDLLDDPVANAARIELEFRDFGEAEVHDFPFVSAGSGGISAEAKHTSVKVHPETIPAPPNDVFRFVRIPLVSSSRSEQSLIKGRENQLAALAGGFLGSEHSPEFLLGNSNGCSLVAWTRQGIVLFEVADTSSKSASACLAGAVERMSDIMVQLQSLSASLRQAAESSTRIADAQPHRQRLLQAILTLKLDAAKPEGEVIQRFLAATGFESVIQTLDTLNEDIDSIVRDRDERAQKRRDQALQLILTVGTAIGLWISWNQMEGLSIREFGDAGAWFWLRYFLGIVLAGVFAAIFWRVASRSSD